ncbi:Uncharacterised protein [uncultured archaeon]|nr:Uncharacterised protein [uncultured archaeon]
MKKQIALALRELSSFEKYHNTKKTIAKNKAGKANACAILIMKPIRIKRPNINQIIFSSVELPLGIVINS